MSHLANSKKTVTKGTKMIMIQKSKGYDWRPSLTNADIEYDFVPYNTSIVIENGSNDIVQIGKPIR